MSDHDESNGREKAAPKVLGREPLRAALPKRFYKNVSSEVVSDPEGLGIAGSDTWVRILLDNRPVKTPKKRPLAVPTLALAAAIAAEWAAQRELIDPATMPLTRFSNTAIDAVADHSTEVAEDIAAFASSDLLCYRAAGQPELAERQAAVWDPVITWGETAICSRIRVATGVMPIEQPGSVRSGVLRVIAAASPFRLASLHVMTTLTGSALLALAHAEGRLGRDETWAAAHLDEDWQIAQWGEDAEASARRAFRFGEFSAASRMLSLLADRDAR